MAEWFDAAQDLEVTVEAAFGHNPLATSPTWTDITSYVSQFDYKRGRSGTFGQFAAGQFNATLDNSDGRFDPAYTSGAYYPDVKSLVPIRVRLNYNAGGATTVWYGFTESWKQQVRKNVHQVVSLRARDGFKITTMLATTTQENQEGTGTRIGNLLDYANWPAAWRSLDTGVETVIFLQTDCKPLTQVIRQIEDAEGGWFYFRADGYATFRDRNDRSTASVSTTFGDGGGSEVPYLTGISIDTDDNEIRNQVAVSRIGGTTQSVDNTSSQSAHGIRTLKQLDVPLTADSNALTLANLLLTRYGTQQQRVGPLQVKPLAAPSVAWSAIIARDINDKVRVKMDPGYGTGIQHDLYIEGLSHKVDFRKRSWLTTYNLSGVE
jgi:hypothetical protein